jgi:flagellar biosynthetic protein FlhB
LLTGPGGLAVVLAGGPPPRRVTIRTAASGQPGRSLRRSAQAARIPSIEAGDLARTLARDSMPGTSIPTERVAELSAIWPG